jgi:L-alanine-DL-glutamate epimerase-like enolase superfamily enzyme
VTGTSWDSGLGNTRRVPDAYRAIEYPISDLVGQPTGQPVYALVGDHQGDGYTVPCYDTALYIDDLHLTDLQQAADLIAAEAHEGDRGHTGFKIKIGRGAMHMPSR